MYKPVVLVILDGWGISNNSRGNVLKETELPTIAKLDAHYPMTTLQASGVSVGLFWGEPGNSEVGHMALGAGKIIYQNLPRITLSIQDRSFFENQALMDSMNKVKEKNSVFHIMGLVGHGSVHSYLEHIYAILEMAKEQELKEVYIHAFMDGRDSPPTSGIQALKDLNEHIKKIGIGKIASLCGRNWAMDRNNNWDRVEKAYRLLTEGKGEKFSDPTKCLEDSYAKDLTDEYIEPSIITDENGDITSIKDDDAVLFFNFREDRARELTKAFISPEFDGFQRTPLKIDFITMVEYEPNLPVNIVFPPVKIGGGLGKMLSDCKCNQLRIAETEKYAHVTYFFNGGKEDAWLGEDRILVPSPAVSKFDESPEMSASQITEKVLEAVEQNKYDLIVINYANADMVGHTANREACITAVKAVDKNLSQLIPTVLQKGGCLLITADHGNIEDIQNFHTGEKNTEHTSNPVPLWFVTPTNHREKSAEEIVRQQNEVGGLLSDIAPTILELLGIDKPEDMNGESLLSMLK